MNTQHRHENVDQKFLLRRKAIVAVEKILRMAPGRELNIMVAKEVMGHEVIADIFMGDTERFVDGTGNSIWGELMPYSEDVYVAEAIINKAVKLGFTDAALWWDFESDIYEPAEAVCKKALLEVIKLKHNGFFSIDFPRNVDKL